MKSLESLESFEPFGPFDAVDRSQAAERVERSEQLTAQCVKDHWGFTLLRPHWNELLRASGADNPFLTWEWLHTWWTHLGSTGALHLVVVRSGSVPIAIAPLRVVKGAFRFSQLEFLGTGFAGSDYLDVIVRREYEDAAVDAIARYLASARLALRLDHVRPDSVAARVARQLAAARWTVATFPGGTCPVVRLDGHTFESYLGTLGASHRANFRRRLRALEHRFDMRFEPASTDPERRELLGLLTAYSAQRWQDQGGSTAFVNPAVRRFQEEATRRAFGRGVLRMYALRLDGDVVAVMYGLMYGGCFYFYQHGFDDRFREHSVGLVLMGLAIRAAIEEGAREFDMLWGTEPYKFLWARDRRELQCMEIFPVHLGGLIHRRAIVARQSVRTLARRVRFLGAHLWS